MANLTQDDSMILRDLLCAHASDENYIAREVLLDQRRPFVLLKPKIYLDGNKWCALYGDDLQSGVCGFGDSPHEASCDFDINWYKKIGVPS